MLFKQILFYAMIYIIVSLGGMLGVSLIDYFFGTHLERTRILLPVIGAIAAYMILQKRGDEEDFDITTFKPNIGNVTFTFAGVALATYVLYRVYGKLFM
jgi:uncharacterized membrane protein YuzA (DUF378 family)